MADAPFSDEDLKAALREQLRQDLKQDLQKEEAAQPAKSRRLWLWSSIAAALLLLLALVLWLSLPANPGGPQDLYLAYFNAYPNELYPIEMGDDEPEAAAVALQNYERGQYAMALTQLEALTREGDNPDLLFYRGVVLLALDRPSEASPVFEAVILHPDGNFRQAAEWYLALSRVAQNDVDGARTALRSIAETETHPYVEEARSLLLRLEAMD